MKTKTKSKCKEILTETSISCTQLDKMRLLPVNGQWQAALSSAKQTADSKPNPVLGEANQTGPDSYKRTQRFIISVYMFELGQFSQTNTQPRIKCRCISVSPLPTALKTISLPEESHIQELRCVERDANQLLIMRWQNGSGTFGCILRESFSLSEEGRQIYCMFTVSNIDAILF